MRTNIIGNILKSNIIGNGRKELTKNPYYLSCYGTGIWEMEGYWFNNDTWKMNPIQIPFLITGIWNDEGIYRFKDAFSFGTSFLPTGIVMFEGIFRHKDNIKVQNENKSVNTKYNINKSYWNF